MQLAENSKNQFPAKKARVNQSQKLIPQTEIKSSIHRINLRQNLHATR